MPNFRPVEKSHKFLAIDFEAQLVPGTFEHAVSVLVDEELDLTSFVETYRNDETGAPAYHPGVLLKVILFGYSRGLMSSRAIAEACRRHVQFMVLSGDSQPDFSTIAAFVSRHDKAIQALFAQVLLICEREVQKIEKAVEKMVSEHQRQDAGKVDDAPEQAKKRLEKITRLKAHAQEIRAWLKKNPEDRIGASGKPVLSNRTDNQSAKMSTDKGVVQGYCAVAAVDEKHQIIVAAQAHGTGSEQALLPGMVEDLKLVLLPESVIVADAGYHSEANLAHLESEKIDAYIADRGYRDRDERYEGQAKHKAKDDALWNKSPKVPKKGRFAVSAFAIAKDRTHAVCPAGKKLYRSGANCNIDGQQAIKFKAAQESCATCPMRPRCLRTPDQSSPRSIAVFVGRHANAIERPIERMRRKLDTAQGREMITRRFATVEPVFANLRYNRGLDRFTLRSRKKVQGQWRLYCLVHNIEKLMKARYAE